LTSAGFAIVRGAAENSRMHVLTVPAPAKLNLFLHVTGRRSDRYHLLESLFVALDFGDTVSLARRDDGLIRRTIELPGVAADDDLAVRAARALQQATGARWGADVGVVKRIPAGGGLGGGSSDAASVLLALNVLWNLRLPRGRLEAIGLALGADVPFFLRGVPALVRGVGEALTPVSIPSLWVCVAIPPVPVSTASIFSAAELTRDTPSAKMEVFSEGYGRNDLQPVAAARHPDIARALAALQTRSPHARMTGSGGCVFAPFATARDARSALAEVPAACVGFIARTLARHPLAGFA
jgi:4-diphosphocytidyl-2-C-methyl-D-erythritol kinase